MIDETEPFDAKRSRSKRPLPLWVDAILADVTDLEADEFGAYMKLLMAMWRRKSVDLVFNERKLARTAGVSLRLWNSRIYPSLEEFFTLEDGVIWQKKLRKEAAYVERQVTLQSNRKRGINPDKSLKDNDMVPSTDNTVDDPRNLPSYNLQPTLDDAEERPARFAANSQSEPETEREHILVAMGHDKSGITANGRIVGSPTDMIELAKWKSLGLDMSEIITVIQHAAARKRGTPAGSFKYFTEAMRELAGEKEAPALKPIEMEQGHGQTRHNRSGNKDEQRQEAIKRASRGSLLPQGLDHSSH